MRKVRDFTGAGIQESRAVRTKSATWESADPSKTKKNGRLAQTIMEDGKMDCSVVSVQAVHVEDESVVLRNTCRRRYPCSR